jgi:hypothetical protein
VASSEAAGVAVVAAVAVLVTGATAGALLDVAAGGGGSEAPGRATSPTASTPASAITRRTLEYGPRHTCITGISPLDHDARRAANLPNPPREIP